MSLQTIEKNKTEQIRIDRKFLNGREFIDCRVYKEDDGTWKPTKKGITIPSEKIDEVIEALLKASIETKLP